MEFLLALGAAAAYGTSDFMGGLLSKTTRVFVVVLLSQLASFVLLLVVAPFWAGEVSWAAISWGLGAGLAAVVGTTLLYQGLAIGRMGVVAPITGVLAAGIPVVFGLAFGERPGPPAYAGVALGLVAVVIITRTPAPAPGSTPPASGGRSAGTQGRKAPRGISQAFGSGVGFGFFFVLLERSPADSGLWPLVSARISILLVLVVIVAAGHITLEVSRDVVPGLLGLALTNVLADLLYLLATREGFLSLVAVITSMYPAVTVLLAATILRERMARLQLFGLGVAVASVALIASG